MTIQEILAGGGGLLLILMTLVQIAPVKINPWSALAKAIGKAINADISKRLDEIEMGDAALQRPRRGRGIGGMPRGSEIYVSHIDLFRSDHYVGAILHERIVRHAPRRRPKRPLSHRARQQEPRLADHIRPGAAMQNHAAVARVCSPAPG